MIVSSTKVYKEPSTKSYGVMSKCNCDDSQSLVGMYKTLEDAKRFLSNIFNEYERSESGKNKVRVYTDIGIMQYWIISLDVVF